MTAASIEPLIESLANISPLEASRFAAILNCSLQKVDENPHWTFYECKPASPFAKVEFQISRKGDQAFISLLPQADLNITEHDLDLSRWGTVTALDLNPRIPPEGADAYIYDVNGVQLSFQFTHTTRRLRLVALEWKGKTQS